MREIVAAPKAPLRVWMDIGLFEGEGNFAGANMLGENRHMRDVLLAKGYRVTYGEHAGAHDYVSWRGTLADGLVELLGAPEQP